MVFKPNLNNIIGNNLCFWVRTYIWLENIILELSWESTPVHSTTTNITKSPWQQHSHLPLSILTHSHARHAASSSAFAFPSLSHSPLPISPPNLLRASPSSPLLHPPPSTTTPTPPPPLKTSPSFSKSRGDSPIHRSNNLLSHCVPRFCSYAFSLLIAKC